MRHRWGNLLLCAWLRVMQFDRFTEADWQALEVPRGIAPPPRAGCAGGAGGGRHASGRAAGRARATGGRVAAVDVLGPAWPE